MNLFFTKITKCKAYFKFFLIFSVLTLCSCATVFHKIHKIKPGTEKYKVFNKLGRPDSATMKRGQEIWTYKFKYKGQTYTQSIYFEKGFLLKRGNIQPFPNYQKALQEAYNVKDYEVKARLLEKQNKAGFSRGINSTQNKDAKTQSETQNTSSQKNKIVIVNKTKKKTLSAKEELQKLNRQSTKTYPSLKRLLQKFFRF